MNRKSIHAWRFIRLFVPLKASFFWIAFDRWLYALDFYSSSIWSTNIFKYYVFAILIANTYSVVRLWLQFTLLPNPVGSTGKTVSSKLIILLMHSVCSSFRDLFKRRSKSSGKFAVRISLDGRHNRFLFWNCTGSQTCNNVTNWNVAKRTCQRLLFFDQSDKSPDSGLAADDSCSKCIRHTFFSPD